MNLLNRKYKAIHMVLVNAAWLTVFLVSTIILLVAKNFGNNPNAVNYIGFAATSASFVVSVIAIVYAISANGTFSDSITRMNKAADQVAKTTKKFTEATAGIQTEVRGLGEKIDNSMRESFIIANEGNNFTAQNESPKLPDDLASSFMQTASRAGLMALYACHLSLEYKKSFSTKNSEDEDDSYNAGFLMCASSIGIIDSSEDPSELIIYGIHPIVESSLMEVINERQKTFIQGLPEGRRDGAEKFFESRVRAINEHFGIESDELQ